MGGGNKSRTDTFIQVVGQVVIDAILVCFHSMIIKKKRADNYFHYWLTMTEEWQEMVKK